MFRYLLITKYLDKFELQLVAQKILSINNDYG